MNNSYLSLDWGGTKLLIGEVSEEGKILQSKRYETGYVNQTEAVDVLFQSLDNYIQTAGWAGPKSPTAIGVGIIGRIDNKNGTWFQIDANRTEPIPLAEKVSKRYHLPCFIDNDVKSATRAEMLFGEGKNSKDFIYLNVGTGIAAGFVVEGKLIRGSHFNAGEVGHTLVGFGVGAKCICGRQDCVELLASGIGFDTCARILKQKYPTKLDIYDSPHRVDVREIVKLYQENDELCMHILDNAIEALSSLIMNLVRVTDPDTVVLGGGVVSNPFIFDRLKQKLINHTMRFVTNGVMLSRLNPDFIGLIGAAAVAINK